MGWLTEFGDVSAQRQRVNLRLTHQDFATPGTHITLPRWLSQVERESRLGSVGQQLIRIQDP